MNGWLYVLWGGVLLSPKYIFSDINSQNILDKLIIFTNVYASIMILYGLFRLLSYMFQIGTYSKPQFKQLDGWLIFNTHLAAHRFIKNFDIPRPWGFLRQLLGDFRQPGLEIFLWAAGPTLVVTGVSFDDTGMIVSGIFIVIVIANLTWRAGSPLRKGELITHKYRNLIGKSRAELKSAKNGDLYTLKVQLDKLSSHNIPTAIKIDIERSALKSLGSKFSDVELLLLIEPGKKHVTCMGIRGIEREITHPLPENNHIANY